MADVDETPSVRVATVVTSFEAKLMAARLGADGVLCQLRGAADSIYPVGTIDVLVEPQRADLARALLCALAHDQTPHHLDDVADVGAIGEDDERLGPPRRARSWAAVGVVVLVVLFMAVRMFSLG